MPKSITSDVRCASASRSASRTHAVLDAGDVLVVDSRDQLRNAVACVPDAATVHRIDGFCVLRPHATTSTAAILLHLLALDRFAREIESTATGGELRRSHRHDRLRRRRFPLPPLPEQRRIAEILDKADALRAKRRAALAQLDTLTQSIFLDMFGDPVADPRGWPTSR